ncbi:LRR receptor-like serine/threonine-protein kinase IOS1 [Bidens hawaiensis]|uniref:LRR receptor-like serine/threonine-protein kinase IOS1 n=1 Tax=Bidens hawaiensis TaxID=980011 RepID=UPI00404B38EA
MHITVVILAPVIGCIVVLSIVVFIVKQRKRKALIKTEEVFTPARKQQFKDEVFTPARKQQFTYSEVVGITNNFQNEIGRGGFGRVFHGYVGENHVAVKMLSESSSQGYKEFQAEVIDRESPNVLSWERRFQIGCDEAEGLAYLHHGCMPPIVHRDVKSSNILLNDGFHANLADFGLSRAFPAADATHVTSSKLAGTLGYLDPEYHATGRLIEKSDVYSFGVVLLELITSRQAISKGIYITNWIKSAVEEGNVENIIDSRLSGCFNINTARKVVDIAIDCISPTSIKRPTMNDVVMDLKLCL